MKKENFLLCGIMFLVCSSKAAGQTCRGKCGDVQDGCSCHATCASLMSCCADYDQWCFQVSPHSSSMLGGRSLRILDVLLRPNESLLCRFKGEIVREGFVDAVGRAHCISPLLYETGWIPLDVSTDGIHFDRSGEYLSVHPSKADPASEVTLVNATQWEHYGTPGAAGRLALTWDRSLVAADEVNVELWGYREFLGSAEAGASGASSLRPQLSYLYSLRRNLANGGAFSFVPESSEEHTAWELGHIRLTAGSVSDGASNVAVLWSRAHVLAWHLEQAFREDSAAWARNKCLRWGLLEKELPGFLDELTDCPCTLAQARADTGRFHTDYSCDIERGSACAYHPGCVHCVRAVQASPQGAGQQCCYDPTGALVLTGDSVGGSTPDRAHDWGSPPYKEPPRVPGYSHWLYDVVSYYHCCLWSDSCDVYFEHRPSSGCRNYRPPKAGFVFGDPHFVTFDGLGYTFSGSGEYALVSSTEGDLNVQARTERVKLKNGTLARGTWLSSVAVKEKTSDVVEVRLSGGHLQVLWNRRVLPFSEQRWMDLDGVFVSAAGRRNVTLMLRSGVGVEARVRDGVMAVTVLLPPDFANRTRGLLGPMNGDPSDDLWTPNGEVVPPDNATAEEIFSFGTSWSISKQSSLFTYDSKYLLDTFGFPPDGRSAIVPAFRPPPEASDDPLAAEASTVCFGAGARFCKFDALATGSLAAGNATLGAYRNFRALARALQTVVSCDWLPTPRNGKKNDTHYLEGTTVSFSCNEGYALYGSTLRTCLADGTWTGEQTCCIEDDVAAFALGAAGAALVLLTMGVMVRRHSRKQSRERKKNPDQMDNQEPTG